jgi:hypothetical protein
MHFDGFTDKRKHLRFRFTGGNATRKVRNIRTVRCRTLLNYDEISHKNLLLLFETSLLKHTIQCSRRNVDAWFPRDSYRPFLEGMVKLTMTTFGTDLKPTISFNQGNKFVNFHSR